jgi:hypothetical protein
MSLRKVQTVSDHLITPSVHHIHIWYWFYTLWPFTYRVYWKEYAVLHKNVSQFKLNLYNQRHLYTFLVARVHLEWSFLWFVRTNPLLHNYFCKHTANRSIRHLQKTVCFITPNNDIMEVDRLSMYSFMPFLYLCESVINMTVNNERLEVFITKRQSVMMTFSDHITIIACMHSSDSFKELKLYTMIIHNLKQLSAFYCSACELHLWQQSACQSMLESRESI